MPMRVVATILAVNVPMGKEGVRGLSFVERMCRQRAPGKQNRRADVAWARYACGRMKKRGIVSAYDAAARKFMVFWTRGCGGANINLAGMCGMMWVDRWRPRASEPREMTIVMNVWVMPSIMSYIHIR